MQLTAMDMAASRLSKGLEEMTPDHVPLRLELHTMHAAERCLKDVWRVFLERL